MRISAITALDRTALIGSEAGLPWHLPMDLKRFRKLTLGKPVIMGRKTFDLIGRALPGRLNIILTHAAGYAPDGCQVAHSLPEALLAAETEGAAEAMVIGGARVYQEALPRCDRLYVTLVDGIFAGTTYFPLDALPLQEWSLIQEEMHRPDEKNPHRHWFLILERSGGQGDLSPSPPPLLGQNDEPTGWSLLQTLALTAR